jgi:hypothetical protein
VDVLRGELVRALAEGPDRLRVWRRQQTGYIVALLGQGLAVGLTVEIQRRWPDVLPYQAVLVIAVGIGVAFQWDLCVHEVPDRRAPRRKRGAEHAVR